MSKTKKNAGNGKVGAEVGPGIRSQEDVSYWVSRNQPYCNHMVEKLRYLTLPIYVRVLQIGGKVSSLPLWMLENWDCRVTVMSSDHQWVNWVDSITGIHRGRVSVAKNLGSLRGREADVVLLSPGVLKVVNLLPVRGQTRSDYWGSQGKVLLKRVEQRLQAIKGVLAHDALVIFVEECLSGAGLDAMVQAFERMNLLPATNFLDPGLLSGKFSALFFLRSEALSSSKDNSLTAAVCAGINGEGTFRGKQAEDLKKQFEGAKVVLYIEYLHPTETAPRHEWVLERGEVGLHYRAYPSGNRWASLVPAADVPKIVGDLEMAAQLLIAKGGQILRKKLAKSITW